MKGTIVDTVKYPSVSKEVFEVTAAYIVIDFVSCFSDEFSNSKLIYLLLMA